MAPKPSGSYVRKKPQRRKKAPSPLGQQLAQARVWLRMSLCAVERETGISNGGISQIETGHVREPSFRTIVLLARAYKLDIETLAELVE